MKLFVDISELVYIFAYTKNANNMTTKQLLQFIIEEEARLWKEYTELRDAYGYDHKATRYASAQWNAIFTLLDEVK